MQKKKMTRHASRTTAGPGEGAIGNHPVEAEAAGVLTPEGELAVDGGKLPGRNDAFEADEAGSYGRAAHEVPGAGMNRRKD